IIIVRAISQSEKRRVTVLPRGRAARRQLLTSPARSRNIARFAAPPFAATPIPCMYQSTLAGQFLDLHPRLAALLGYSSAEEAKAAITDIRNQLYACPDHRDQ